MLLGTLFAFLVHQTIDAAVKIRYLYKHFEAYAAALIGRIL